MSDRPTNGRRLTRRQALGLGGGAAASAALGVAAWRALIDDGRGPSSPAVSPVPTTTTAPPTNDRVLLVVQLDGGNDALNTLVPVADGRYHDLRPTLGVPDEQVVTLAGEARFGLHPAMAPLAASWEAGELAALVPAGFDGQSRSHFAARDLWWAATPGRASPAGWLGRWLDATGEPNPLRSVSLGSRSPALMGDEANATFIGDPARFRLVTPRAASADELAAAFAATAVPMSDYAPLATAQRSIPAALEAIELLEQALPGADAPLEDAGPDAYETASFTALLETAANIFGFDVGTRVIVVGSEGFDTHSAQSDTHQGLLTDLAGGLDGFFTAMAANGRRDDVLVITTSEFGRRVHENGSAGTDHGNGGVLFAIGAGVAGEIVGDVDLGSLVEGDLPSAIDARSLYAVALDWLGGVDSAEILDGDFDRYDLLAT